MSAALPISVDDWLVHLEALRPEVIELGLERVREVAVRARLIHPGCVVITVGGTNGKGSVCAMLDSILRAAGYRVGLYTSPHLLRFQERIRIDGQDIADADLCASFAAVEAARDEIPLTYFEFATLAAVSAFYHAQLDVMILEVGLGGRLDAVNIFDADCSVVTTVDLDHQEWLGDTREAIGFEKAGIFRGGRPAVCGDANPPASLLEHVQGINADLWLLGRDYGYQFEPEQWQYWGRNWRRSSLAWPALRGAYQLSNASTALAVLEVLAERLPLAMGDIRRGLLEVEWPARFQVLPGRPTVILDVAHNPQAARSLRQALDSMGYFPRTHVVLGMLNDKEVAAVGHTLQDLVDHWYLASLPGPRGMSAEQLGQRLQLAATAATSPFADAQSAFAAAYKQAADGDRIVVFGSFLTVAAVLRQTRGSAFRDLRDGH